MSEEPSANPFSLAAAWIRNKTATLQHQTRVLQEVNEPPTSWAETIDGHGPGDRFQDREATRDMLRQLRQIREDGGIAITLLEIRSLMVFGVGGEWQAEDDDLAEWLNENLPATDSFLHDIGLDTYTYGYALAEPRETRGGDFSDLVCIQPWTTVPEVDDKGQIKEWEQAVAKTSGASKKIQDFDPEDIFHFKTVKRSGRDEVGMSLLARAMDEVETFRDNQRAIRNAIKLYGFPKLHAKLGRENGPVIDDNELRRARPMFQNISEDSQWITGTDVEIDFKTPETVEFGDITEHDLAKLAIVFMLPLEIAQLGGGEGLGSGFPARVRERMFLLSAKAHQRMVANQLRDQVAHRLLTEFAGFAEQRVDEAKVRFVFDEPLVDMDEIEAKVSAVGDDMTVNERRNLFDLAPLEDESTGEQFLAPAEEERAEQSAPPPGGGFFQASRALQEAGLATEVLEWASEFVQSSQGSTDQPVSSFEDWLVEFADTPSAAFDRLEVALAVWAAAQGVETDQARAQPVANLIRFLERHRNLSAPARDATDEDPFWWEPHLDAMIEKVAWADDTTRPLFGFSEGKTPQFVQQRMLDAVLEGSPIFSDLETIPDRQLMDFRMFMASKLTEEGWTISEMQDRIMQDFGVDEQEAEVLARSTTQNMVSEAAEEGYKQRDDPPLVKWPEINDGRDSDVCMAIVDEVESRGGAVPIDELKEIVHAKADEYDLDARGWSPHPQCRRRPVAVAE